MKKLIHNYQQPTPPYWRKIGDMALFLIPILEAQFALMPIPETPEMHWFKWGITTFLVIFKAYTNTQVHEVK
jgi:hypothetical protein